MRSGRWSAARWTLTTLCAAAALAGCGGGGSSAQSDLDIVVKVNGTQVAGPWHGDTQQSITVASGDQVEFVSTSGVSYALELTDVEAPGSSHDDRHFEMTLTSIVGGSADMEIASSDDTSDKLSVKVVVQPQQFVNRTWSVGETLVQDDISGSETRRYTRHVIDTADDGSYTIQTDTNLAYLFTDSYNADSNHTRFSADDLSGSDSPENRRCRETPARLIKDFPLFVGKSWEAEWDEECSLEYRYHHVATNQVAGYETVTVPAGSFPALRILSDRTVTDEFGQVSRAQTECWWSVEFQQDVRCDESLFRNDTQIFHFSSQIVQLAGQLAAQSATSASRVLRP